MERLGLSAVPAAVAQLTALTEVNLSHNHISELPDGPWLQKIQILDLNGNLFDNIPSRLVKYKGTLKEVYLMDAINVSPELACPGFASWRCKTVYQELVSSGVQVKVDWALCTAMAYPLG